MSQISEFFNGKTVFITGATGFVGKVLVEKLLRCCSGVERIFILIRPKNGHSFEDRWKNYCNLQIFKLALHDQTLIQKLTPIEGDLSLPNIGLKDSDLDVLINSISIIFHVAGDVKFNESVRDAVTHNLIGTYSMLKLCNQMNHLKAFVHVSTAYAFCQFNELEEKIYPMKVTPEEVISAVNTMNDNQLSIFTEKLLEGRPNHYTFAKALAEHVVLKERQELPVAIVRPSIILATYKDPVSGWCDNFNGATGISILGSLGIMRIVDFDTETRLSFIPVDYTCNAVIAAAFHVATTRPSDIQIYHLTSEPKNTPPIVKLVQHFALAQHDSPSIKLVRPHAGIPRTRPSKVRVCLTKLISHLLFAYFLDTIIWIMGYKPIMVRITQRMHAGFEMLSYFWMRQWTFQTDNARRLLNVVKSLSPLDAEMFDFDTVNIDWDTMIKMSWIGGRRYLLKEDDDSIPLAKKRLNR